MGTTLEGAGLGPGGQVEVRVMAKVSWFRPGALPHLSQPVSSLSRHAHGVRSGGQGGPGQVS